MVKLAARVQAAADPGGILISYPTRALVRDIGRAEERGSIAAKGIRRGVRVFERAQKPVTCLCARFASILPAAPTVANGRFGRVCVTA